MIIQGKVWGETRPLFNKNNVEIHFVDIKKGGYCSKHYHRSKFNKFMVMNGKLKITVWKNYGKEILEDISILHTGQACIVAPGDFHRFEALEDTQALEIYWVELNDHDIVREDHGGLKDEEKTDICNDAGEQDFESYSGSKLAYSVGLASNSNWKKESA
jgi:quercetin dioxygenase-like cupin family protein